MDEELYAKQLRSGTLPVILTYFKEGFLSKIIRKSRILIISIVLGSAIFFTILYKTKLVIKFDN